MVKSGLDKETFSKENSLPRVSQYWLAAHLTSAIVLYTGLFSSALVETCFPSISYCLAYLYSEFSKSYCEVESSTE